MEAVGGIRRAASVGGPVEDRRGRQKLFVLGVPVGNSRIVSVGQFGLEPLGCEVPPGPPLLTGCQGGDDYWQPDILEVVALCRRSARVRRDLEADVPRHGGPEVAYNEVDEVVMAGSAVHIDGDVGLRLLDAETTGFAELTEGDAAGGTEPRPQGCPAASSHPHPGTRS